MSAISFAIQVDAVGEESPSVQHPGPRETLDDGGPEPRPAVRLVGGVLRDVDVQAGPGLAGGRRAGVERRLRQRERGVRADHRPGERQRAGGDPPGEAPVLAEPGGCAIGTVPIGDLVGENAPDADRCERVGDDVQGAVDRVRGGVVIDEGGRPGEQRLHAADKRGGADRRLVERAVEAPPDAAQDLHEVARRLEVEGHAPGERRVQVGVGAHVARDHEAAAAVDAPVAGLGVRGTAEERHAPAVHHHIGRLDLDGFERRHHRAADERQGHLAVSPAPAAASRSSRASSALAAAESRIGRLVRRIPSKA